MDVNITAELAKGGTAIVLFGVTGYVKEFSAHPRVKFIDARSVPGDALTTEVPDNTKVIIVTDGLPMYHRTWIHTYSQRRKIPYLVRKSNQAIYEDLKRFFPENGGEAVKPSPEEVKDAFKKGKLDPLIPFIDFSKSNAEAGRALFRKANELNIKSTEASLIQLVGNQRKRLHGGTVPKSARPKLDVSVEMLDEAIKGLTDMREFLIATVEENRVLRSKLDKYRKALDAIE